MRASSEIQGRDLLQHSYSPPCKPQEVRRRRVGKVAEPASDPLAGAFEDHDRLPEKWRMRVNKLTRSCYAEPPSSCTRDA